jgi:PleD family two-component response regulator
MSRRRTKKSNQARTLDLDGNSMTLPFKAPQRTILVVEDAALVLNTVRMILLENANFTVLAASADEAMRLAGCAKQFQLLLSDVMMPDMSGRNLAAAEMGTGPKAAEDADGGELEPGAKMEIPV